MNTRPSGSGSGSQSSDEGEPPRRDYGKAIAPEEHHEKFSMSKENELSFDHERPLSIRKSTDPFEWKQIKLFLEGMVTDVKSEVYFLKDMLDFYSTHNEYPFDNDNALDEFVRTSIGVNVSRHAVLEQIHQAKERYEGRAIVTADPNNEFEFRDSDYEQAFRLGEQIWGPATETQHEHAADQLESNSQQSENRNEEGTTASIGQDAHDDDGDDSTEENH